MPAVLLCELLHAQVVNHRGHLRLPAGVPGAAKGAHGKRGGVVRIVGDIAVRQPQRARRLGARPYEHDGSGDACGRRPVDIFWHLEQRVQDERSQRLPRSQQAVSVAVPSAIGLLAAPQPGGGLVEDWLRSGSTGGERQHKRRKQQPAHQRFFKLVWSTGAGSRSAVNSRMAALVTATRPVMQ